MNITSLRAVQNPTEAASFLKALRLGGEATTDAVSAAISANQDALFTALQAGNKDAVDSWIDTAKKSLTNPDDIRYITGDLFKQTMLDIAQKQAFKNEFVNAYIDGQPVDALSMAAKFGQENDDLPKKFQELIAQRESDIVKLAEGHVSRHGGDATSPRLLDAARQMWVVSNSDNLKALWLNDSAPTATAQATTNVPPPRTIGSQFAPEQEKFALPVQQQQAQARGAAIAPLKITAPMAPIITQVQQNPTTLAAARYEMPAANTTADYITSGEIAKQSKPVQFLSKLIGDGKPYGDYNEATAKHQVQNNAYPQFVVPENAPHFIHTMVKFGPRNFEAVGRKISIDLLTGASSKLRHNNLPNVFADTLYIRPVIKEVDARMKATGFSETVVEMQKEMRNLTEAMTRDPSMTAEDYKLGMKNIYDQYTASGGIHTYKFQNSSKLFIEGLDKVIAELRQKKDALTKPVTYTDEQGNAIPLPADRKAFASEADAGGKTGLTQYQVDTMIKHYQDIRETALQISNPDADFLAKYLGEVPEKFIQSSQREELANHMRTALIGYHLEDGVVGGSRLGRIGSEVEQRNTGYNIFKFDDHSLKAAEKWHADFAAGKAVGPKPEMHAALARYDEMCRLERSLKNELAITADRITPLVTKGNRDNAEAQFFKLLHEFERSPNGWDVSAGDDFAMRLIGMEKQGYEEQIAELIDMLINRVGADTSANKTMPIARIDNAINAILKESKDNEYRLQVFGPIREKLDRLKQSPMPDGARDVLAKEWSDYYMAYYLARAFAADERQAIEFPSKGLVIGAVRMVNEDAANDLKHAMELNMPASYPQKYLTQQWFVNNMWKRPIAYMMGIDTVDPRFKTAKNLNSDVTDHKNYFATDNINWKKLLWWSGEGYTPIEGQKPLSIKAHQVKTFFDNSPAYVKFPLRAMSGGLDLLGSEGVKKAGVLAYAARAFYGSVAVGGTVYIGGSIAVNGGKDGKEASQDVVNVALAPMRMGVKYGIGDVYGKEITTIERGVQGLVYLGTGAVTLGNYPQGGAYLGLGEWVSSKGDNIADYSTKIRLGGSSDNKSSFNDASGSSSLDDKRDSKPAEEQNNGSSWDHIYESANANQRIQLPEDSLRSSYNSLTSGSASGMSTPFNNRSVNVTTTLSQPVITTSSLDAGQPKSGTQGYTPLR